MIARILIIDDNEKNIGLMRLLLKHAGCEVISANSDSAGLEAIRQEMPDLILVDLQTPEMNGMQIAQKIRLDEYICHIPVIGMSEYATPSMWNRALRSGMKGFFEKPINQERLTELIRKLVPSIVKTA
jgi:two-component system cell cycle response regulator DivK